MSVTKPINYLSTSYLVKRVAKEYIFVHYKTLLLSISLMLLVAGTTSFHAWLIKPALDQVFVKKDHTALILIPLVVLLVSAVKGFATYFQLLTMNILSQRIAADMRLRLYAKFIKSDMAKLHSSSSGSMTATILGEVGSIVGMINQFMNGSVKQFFTIFGLVAVMFYQSVELALISFIALPLAIIPIYKVGKKLRNLSYTSQSQTQDFASHLNDTLQYTKLVKSYNCEDFEIKRMSKISEAMFKVSKKIARLSLISSPFVETLAGVGVACVIWYGGMQIIAGKTTPGAFFSFFAAMMMAYRPLKTVSGMNNGIQLGLAAATRYYTIIDEQAQIVDRPNAIELENARGDIKFENAMFSYARGKTVLKNVNFEAEAGKTTALVGHSGGGKSTIMNLILRFYDLESGVIKIDGHDIRDLTLHSLRASMSVVNQEVMLFDDTVLENIRYGKEGATEEQIINAAILAEADSFISELPEGYKTKIGQNGIRLSGGQRQRIAIARAILYNAPILLLDEATSALDPISERLIRNALRKLMKNRTTIVIAHRLSTVIHADKICVVSDGKIIESGNHDELLKANGTYANLYLKQFEPEDEDI